MDTGDNVKNEAKQMLRVDEGFRQHVYLCSAGRYTIGYGRNVDQRGGPGITRDEGEYLLTNDVSRIYDMLLRVYPWILQLTPMRQAALIDMCYQLGDDGFAAFKQTLGLLKSGFYKDAARALRDSKYYRQTTKRVERLAQILEG